MDFILRVVLTSYFNTRIRHDPVTIVLHVQLAI